MLIDSESSSIPGQFTSSKTYILLSPSSVVLLSVVAQFLPLLKYTDYEFSVITGLSTSIIVGLAAINLSRYFRSIKGIINYASLIVLMPLAISLLFNFLRNGCPPGSGIWLYFLIVIPSATLGIALAFLIRENSIKNKRTWFLFFWVLLFVYPWFAIYFQPQIYLYHPWIGYFPGTIYDELIEPDLKFIIYRLSVFLFAFGMIVISVIIRFEKRAAAYFLLIPLIFLTILKYDLGFGTSEASLRNSLGDQRESAHFQYVFDDRIDESLKKVIMYFHEFNYNDLQKLSASTPEKKIISYIFNDDYDKKKYFGSKNADVAKPWLNSIFISGDNFSETLRHELAHIFASANSDNIFKVAANINPAIIEGYAMALENEYLGFDIDYFAKMALKKGNPDIGSLFEGLNFFGNTSAYSYLLAGSFMKYLGANYGFDKVNNFHRTGDLFGAIGIHRDTLFSNYWEYIRAIPVLTDSNTEKLIYGYKPIISKYCPRYIAKSLRDAEDEFMAGEYEKAKRSYSSILDKDNSYQALRGIISADIKEGFFSDALVILKKYMPHFSQTGYIYNLKLLEIRLLYYIGNNSSGTQKANAFLRESPLFSYQAEVEKMKLLAELDYYRKIDIKNTELEEVTKTVYDLFLEKREPLLLNTLLNLYYSAYKFDKISDVELNIGSFQKDPTPFGIYLSIELLKLYIYSGNIEGGRILFEYLKNLEIPFEFRASMELYTRIYEYELQLESNE